MHLTTLATELTHRTLWYPTILGVLAVAAGVTLFCGSVYLLLATNLGARLGFLVAAAALSGFMVILSFFWITTASPLNTLRGRLPAWQVKELVASPADSRFAAVHDVEQAGREVDTTEAANVKAFVDEALVVKTPVGGEPAVNGPFAKYSDTTKYLTPNTWETGGSKPNPLKLQLTHKTLYSVVEVCPALDQPVEFGLPPATPKCDPAQPAQFAVLRFDYGSVRVPPFVAFVAAIICFVASLLGLHWWERDAREAARRAAAPARRPQPVTADV